MYLTRATWNSLFDSPSEWQAYGNFHLQFEKWNMDLHSRPLGMKGFGGWISIKKIFLEIIGVGALLKLLELILKV